jgi:hypothetical protein
MIMIVVTAIITEGVIVLLFLVTDIIFPIIVGIQDIMITHIIQDIINFFNEKGRL